MKHNSTQPVVAMALQFKWYGLDNQGFISWQGQEIFHQSIQTGSGSLMLLILYATELLLKLGNIH